MQVQEAGHGIAGFAPGQIGRVTQTRQPPEFPARFTGPIGLGDKRAEIERDSDGRGGDGVEHDARHRGDGVVEPQELGEEWSAAEERRVRERDGRKQRKRSAFSPRLQLRDVRGHYPMLPT